MTDTVPLGNGWRAVGEATGWRGVAEDGRQTHLHLNVEVVARAIAHGWLADEASVIAPAAVATFSRARRWG